MLQRTDRGEPSDALSIDNSASTPQFACGASQNHFAMPSKRSVAECRSRSNPIPLSGFKSMGIGTPAARPRANAHLPASAFTVISEIPGKFQTRGQTAISQSSTGLESCVRSAKPATVIDRCKKFLSENTFSILNADEYENIGRRDSSPDESEKALSEDSDSQFVEPVVKKPIAPPILRERKDVVNKTLLRSLKRFYTRECERELGL